MGLGADASLWELHLAAYRDHFRCFAVDNRGVGYSSAPSHPYTTESMADDYAGLIRALELGRVRVVGISMGGAIAQQLVLRHPDLVDRMVLVASWARCDDYTAEVFNHFARVRAVVEPEVFTQLLQLWIWAPRYVNSHLVELRETRVVPPPLAMSQAAFEAQCHACITHDASDRLPELSLPTLITAGAADIFTPLRLAQDLHDRISGSQLEIFPAAGHAHHWEALDEFNQLTTNWLSR